MFDDIRWRIAIGKKIGEAAQILKSSGSIAHVPLGGQRRRERLENAEKDGHTQQDVLDKWGTTCHICGKDIDMQAPRGVGRPGWERGLHLDHVIPLSRGGSHTLENVKPSHAQCNIRKNNHLATALAQTPQPCFSPGCSIGDLRLMVGGLCQL